MAEERVEEERKRYAIAGLRTAGALARSSGARDRSPAIIINCGRANRKQRNTLCLKNNIPREPRHFTPGQIILISSSRIAHESLSIISRLIRRRNKYIEPVQ